MTGQIHTLNFGIEDKTVAQGFADTGIEDIINIIALPVVKGHGDFVFAGLDIRQNIGCTERAVKPPVRTDGQRPTVDRVGCTGQRLGDEIQRCGKCVDRENSLQRDRTLVLIAQQSVSDALQRSLLGIRLAAVKGDGKMIDGQLVFGQLCQRIRSIGRDRREVLFGTAFLCADRRDLVAFDVQMRLGIGKVCTDDKRPVLRMTAYRLCFQRVKINLDHTLDTGDGNCRTVDCRVAEIDDINELACIGIADHLTEASLVVRGELDLCRSRDFLKGCCVRKPGKVGFFALDSGRLVAVAPNLTAVCKELLEQGNGCFIDGIKGRNDNIIVSTQTDTDLFALNGAHLCHHAFIAPMIGNLCLRQLVGQRTECILYFLDGMVILTALVGQVCRVHRVDDEGIGIFFTEGEHVAEVVEVVVELLHLFLPRQMLGVVRRIVALSLSADGVCIQVLAHDVDTADILQFSNALQLGRCDVPAAAAEHFGKRLLLAKLCAGRTELLGRNIGTETASEIVDARNVFVFIERHDTADAHHLSCERGFLDSVTGQTAAVFLTPVIDRLDPVIDKQLVAELPVIVAEFLITVKVDEQCREIVKYVIAVCRLKLCRHLVAPDGTPAVILRLVGEEAGHCVTEVIGISALLVFVMGFDQELCGNFCIQRIDIRFVPSLCDDMIFGDTVHGSGDAGQLAVNQRINAEDVCKGCRVCIDLCIL